MFRIETDKSSRLVRVEVFGFWQPQDIADFIQQEQAAVRSLNVPAGSHRLLVDVRNMKIQSQQVIEGLRHVSDTAVLKAARFAFIVSPGLIRQQVKRAVAGRTIGVFDDEPSALAYLKTDTLN